MKVHQVSWNITAPNILNFRILSCVTYEAGFNCAHYGLGNIILRLAKDEQRTSPQQTALIKVAYSSSPAIFEISTPLGLSPRRIKYQECYSESKDANDISSDLEVGKFVLVESPQNSSIHSVGQIVKNLYEEIQVNFMRKSSSGTTRIPLFIWPPEKDELKVKITAWPSMIL